MAYAHRYLFCIRPPALLAGRISAFRDGSGSGGRIVANEQLHLTLGITDDYPEYRPPIAKQMIRIGDAVQAEPFRIGLDRLSGSGSVVALRPSRTPLGLGILQREIDRRLSYSGLRRSGWTFNPHMTLIYGGHQPFLRPVQPFEWEAAKFVLIHSPQGEGRHVELARWPLKRCQLKLAL